MDDLKNNKKIDSQDSVITSIIRAISGIKFGEVMIKIQDGKIIQIERIEKIRLNKLADSESGKAIV